MICHSCGSQLLPEAKFCPLCGASTLTSTSNSGQEAEDRTFVSEPSNSSQPGSSPVYEPTVVASPPDTPSFTPSTTYGAYPYVPSDQPPIPSGSYNPYTPPPINNPYIAPQAEPYPAYPPAPTQAGLQGRQPARRFPVVLTLLLIILALLLIGGGSGLIYYTAVYQPDQVRAHATATAIVQFTGTARAQATSTAQANATATAVAMNPYTNSGTLAFYDPLTDNSKGNNWAEDPINCGFSGGAYHAKAPNPKYSDYCLANSTDLSNFAFEVQMQIIQGDAGGIVFRSENTSTANRLYAFYIGQTGSYFLNRENGSDFPLLTSGTSAAIKQGLNQTNLLAVVAQGSIITLYVNHQQIASITDNTFSHGQIGFIVSPLINTNHPTEVVFTNAKVWTL